MQEQLRNAINLLTQHVTNKSSDYSVSIRYGTAVIGSFSNDQQTRTMDFILSIICRSMTLQIKRQTTRHSHRCRHLSFDYSSIFYLRNANR